MVENKKGQVTIFIILGIIIVSAILVFFLWIKPTYITPSGGRFGFEGCVADAVEQGISDLGLQAGYINPDLNYVYRDQKIGYLCYTNLYYKSCTVTKPFLKQHFKEQLEKKVREQIELCYKESVNELKSKGYDVVSGTPTFSFDFVPGKVNVNIEAPTSISRGTTQSFTNFKAEVKSPIYDILMIATSILQFEVKYGDSDVTSMMAFNQDFLIDKLKQSEGTTIYIIEDRTSKTKFQFATRSFAYPAGYGMDSGLVMQ